MSCNRAETPPALKPAPVPEFTYTAPIKLLEAIRVVEGYEDSHDIPGHEKLGHDHSTPESWTTENAVKDLIEAAKEYKKLNPHFEMIAGHCYIPGHYFHSYAESDEMKHHKNNAEFTGSLKEATKALKEVKEASWVLVFEDRLLAINLENRTLMVKEKRLSP